MKGEREERSRRWGRETERERGGMDPMGAGIPRAAVEESRSAGGEGRRRRAEREKERPRRGEG